jgi:hypothetical protein
MLVPVAAPGTAPSGWSIAEIRLATVMSDARHHRSTSCGGALPARGLRLSCSSGGADVGQPLNERLDVAVIVVRME